PSYAPLPTRLLHSSPTRRSSDLGGSSRSGAGKIESGAAGTSAVDDLAFDLDLVAVCLQAGLPVGRALEHATRAAGDRSGLGQIRSEEHTSELQSRFDLVCRLLLE